MAGRENPTKARSSIAKGNNSLGRKTFKEPNIIRVSGEIDADNDDMNSVNMNKREARDPIGPDKRQILDRKGWRERNQTSI
jgi:hypothetical protein